MGRRSRKYKFDFTPIGQEVKQAREARKISRERLPNVKSKLQKIIKNFSNARNQGFARRATPDFFLSAAK